MDAYSDDQPLKLITNAKTARWDVDDVGGDPVEDRVRKAIEDRAAHPDPAVERLKNEIRNTAVLMAAFGEQDAYLPYRHLSSYSHTTRETAQIYLHSAGAGGWEIRNRPRPNGLGDVIWTAVCLIQAGRVIDSILTGQPLATRLDAATGHLGVSADIVPTRLAVPEVWLGIWEFASRAPPSGQAGPGTMELRSAWEPLRRAATVAARGRRGAAGRHHPAKPGE
ncbi:hypothetical protein [Streptomyces mirabilis]|uniref:hypothetical protein n=1 Tax=Streptomyces mirabilis TaxID=68239 RepID=UPI003677B4C3